MKTKISKDELEKVEEKLTEINSLLMQNADFEKINNKTFEVEITDKEIEERANELGYDFDSEKSVGDSYDIQPPSSDEMEHDIQPNASNGINKIKVHWWGYEIWLSKTSVSRIAQGGVATASLILGIMVPGIGIAVALAANTLVWSWVIDGKARAIYFQYNVITGTVSNVRAQ